MYSCFLLIADLEFLFNSTKQIQLLPYKIESYNPIIMSTFCKLLNQSLLAQSQT